MEVQTYSATARREGKWWIVDVPGVGVTQARTVKDVPMMATDLIVQLKDVPESSVNVAVSYAVEGLTSWAESKTLASEAVVLSDRSASLARDAVVTLEGQGLKNIEIAEVLHISPQRVSQLRKHTGRKTPANH